MNVNNVFKFFRHSGIKNFKQMKNLRLIIIGIAFGFILTKGEVISWFRLFEMFRFESFHLFGVIGSAVVVSFIFNQWIKRSKMKSIDGEPIEIPTFYSGFTRYIIGGIIFGFGWALTGACPGPLYTLFGKIGRASCRERV